MKTFSCLLLVALGACAAPGRDSVHQVSALRAGSHAQAAPQTYQDWVEGLPVLSLESTAFRTSAQGKLALEIQQDGVELSLNIQLGLELEYLDLRHFREDIWIHVEAPSMPGLIGSEDVGFALKILADGTKLFLRPEFQEDALGAQVKASGLGLEDMTFTLDIALFEQLMRLYWHSMENADLDMSSLLPVGTSSEEFFERGLNPAGWARTYLLTSDILDFRVDSNEVRIKARMKEELLGNAVLRGSNSMPHLGEVLYEMSFDRFTGLPTSMTVALPIENTLHLVFELDFAEFEMGSNLFAPSDFSSEQLHFKQLFPIDTFVQMALASMQAGLSEDDDDMAF